ncbi:MAG: SPOR domain-containing protein, partial [Candidatus Binatia bacterium]
RRGGVHLASVSKARGSTQTTTKEVSSGTQSAGARYTVRLGPYASRREAESARNRLARKGYRGRVVGQALLMGEFPSRERADRLVKGLRLKGYHPTIVARR